MKSKILITVLVILSVVEYTLAVINFTQWAVLPGIQAVALAVTMMILAYGFHQLNFYETALKVIGKSHFDLIETMKKGVRATLTLKDGKATVALHDDDPDDEDDTDAPDPEHEETTDSTD